MGRLPATVDTAPVLDDKARHGFGATVTLPSAADKSRFKETPIDDLRGNRQDVGRLVATGREGKHEALIVWSSVGGC